ncbi:MAG: mechanosensitive ion channel family protein [Candidatus Xenobia bacterium]
MIRRVAWFLLWCLLAAPCLAQSPSPSALPPPLIAPAAEAPVMLQGLTLLKVGPSGDLTATERARVLHDRLEAVLARNPSGPTVRVDVVRGMPAVMCEGVPLLTVTPDDAALEHTDQVTLAGQWEDALQQGLLQVAAERDGQYLDKAIAWSGAAILLALLLQLTLRWATHRRHLLHTPGWSLYFLIWLAATSFVMAQFPRTRSWGNVLGDTILWPLSLLLLVIVCATAAARFLAFVSDRYFAELEAVQRESEPASSRWQQRALTLRQVSRVIVNLVVVVVAVIAWLSLLRINITALIAGASVVGVALGFATQDILKDMAAGVNIVLEDQFGVGDWMRGASQEGTVVGFTLRATQLRTLDGHLITIPNSALRVVENCSTGWSKIDIRVNVGYNADVRKAIETLQQIAQEVKEAFPVDVQGEPEMLGVDSLGDTVHLRMLLHTTSAGATTVKRELLLRIKERLGEANMFPATTPPPPPGT